jgi:regulator of replication initiation timing
MTITPPTDETQPLTDEELEAIRASAEWAISANNAVRLLTEVDRLRAELAEMRSERDNARAIASQAINDVDRLRAEVERRERQIGLHLKLANEEVKRADALAARLREVDADYVRARENMAEAITQRNAARMERDALAAKLAAVEKVIEPEDPDWKPLSERHPEYFKPVTPEEAARKKGWRQGVDLLKQQIRAALGETGGTE